MNPAKGLPREGRGAFAHWVLLTAFRHWRRRRGLKARASRPSSLGQGPLRLSTVRASRRGGAPPYRATSGCTSGSDDGGRLEARAALR